MSIKKTHSDFDSVFVANQTDLRGPGIACDDCRDEHEAFVVGRVGSGYMRAIRRPAVRIHERRVMDSHESVSPQAPEESATW